VAQRLTRPSQETYYARVNEAAEIGIAAYRSPLSSEEESLKIQQLVILSLVFLIPGATYGQQSPVRVESKGAKVEENSAASLEATTIAVNSRSGIRSHLCQF
jgi:hypothetical protein